MARKRWNVGDVISAKVDDAHSFLFVLRELPMADFLDASDPNSINSESDIENHWIFRIFVDHSIFRNKEVFKKIKNIHAGHSDKMQTYRYDDIRDKYYLIISGHPKGEEVSKECA